MPQKMDKHNIYRYKIKDIYSNNQSAWMCFKYMGMGLVWKL